MSKQLQELRSFNAGTILSPDVADIPIEAASYSLNIDSVTEDGKLKGVPGDTPITVSINNGGGDIPQTPSSDSPISYLLRGSGDNMFEALVIYNGSTWVVDESNMSGGR